MDNKVIKLNDRLVAVVKDGYIKVNQLKYDAQT